MQTSASLKSVSCPFIQCHNLATNQVVFRKPPSYKLAKVIEGSGSYGVILGILAW